MNQPSPTRKQQLAAWIASGNAKKWREDSGHTHDYVARKLGVTRNSVFRWENGQVRPSKGNWRRYYDYLKSIRPTEEEPCPPPRSQSSGEPAPAASPDAPSASSA